MGHPELQSAAAQFNPLTYAPSAFFGRPTATILLPHLFTGHIAKVWPPQVGSVTPAEACDRPIPWMGHRTIVVSHRPSRPCSYPQSFGPPPAWRVSDLVRWRRRPSRFAAAAPSPPRCCGIASTPHRIPQQSIPHGPPTGPTLEDQSPPPPTTLDLVPSPSIAPTATRRNCIRPTWTWPFGFPSPRAPDIPRPDWAAWSFQRAGWARNRKRKHRGPGGAGCWRTWCCHGPPFPTRVGGLSPLRRWALFSSGCPSQVAYGPILYCLQKQPPAVAVTCPQFSSQ